MNNSDLIIIGGGPGGYETAAAAARQGLKVTLFERDALGGTCLNRGCIPTKALCRAAEVLATVRDAAAFGVTVGDVTADYDKAHARIADVVSTLRSGIEMQLKEVDIVRATARILPDGTVEADGQVYSAPKVIIATGSRPASLPIPGAELAMTSDHLLALDTLPESIVIIGGGVIGMEFASILATYGVQVTVVEYCKEILPPFDADIAKRLRTAMSRRGVKFIVGAAVTAISEADGTYTVTYTGKKGEAAVEARAVLMATGRMPVFPDGLDEAGIEYTRKGIKVDDQMQTTRPGVYAIGDVNGRCMLAHAATAQGKVVLGADIDLSVIPSAVFTCPELAMVGMKEEEAREKCPDMRVRTVMYGASGKALAMGESFGQVKMMTAPDGRILGCTVIGAHASDLVQEVATAMANGLPVSAIADTVHAHPTLAELVMLAAE